MDMTTESYWIEGCLNDYDEIGQVIKNIREDHLGLTQEEFALKLGKKKDVIAKYENGKAKPGKGIIDDICSTFDLEAIFRVKTK